MPQNSISQVWYTQKSGATKKSKQMPFFNDFIYFAICNGQCPDSKPAAKSQGNDVMKKLLLSNPLCYACALPHGVELVWFFWIKELSVISVIKESKENIVRRDLSLPVVDEALYKHTMIIKKQSRTANSDHCWYESWVVFFHAFSAGMTRVSQHPRVRCVMSSSVRAVRWGARSRRMYTICCWTSTLL